MNQTKISLVGLGLALTLLLGLACAKSLPDPKFENQAQGLLRVANDLEQRFVLFRGEPSRESYLGGIPGRVEDFGFDTAPGVFLLTAVKVEDYMLHRTNANALPLAWSRVVVLSSNHATRQVIDQTLSGRGRVRFENNRDAYLVIRSGTWDGPVITTLEPRSSRVRYLPYNDFVLRPLELGWETNQERVTARERPLTEAADMIGVYPDEVLKITID